MQYSSIDKVPGDPREPGTKSLPILLKWCELKSHVHVIKAHVHNSAHNEKAAMMHARDSTAQATKLEGLWYMVDDLLDKIIRRS